MLDRPVLFEDRRLLRGRGRWRLLAGVWLVYLVPSFHEAWTEHTGGGRVLRLLLLVAFCYVYADLVARALTGAEWLRWWAPGLLLALAAALAVVAGVRALGATIYVVVAVAVLLPRRIALPFAALATVLVGVLPQLVPSWHETDSWAQAGSVALGALAAFGFIALLRRTTELRAAQQEVSRLAAERERMRIARDLHDLLGHSLTAVTVKAQLAGRLVGRDDARAAAEMLAVERLSRQALADVRAAVAGYREVSLAVELATAREVLGAAGISADLPGAVDEVPAELRELFGWAVREGVTNAVRHSGARRVRVQVTASSVEVTDDGRGRLVGATAGSGLAGLAERAAAAGGQVEAGPDPAGGFRLRLTVPPAPPAPTPSAGAGSSGLPPAGPGSPDLPPAGVGLPGSVVVGSPGLPPAAGSRSEPVDGQRARTAGPDAAGTGPGEREPA
jgi:two-component system sensor histidine kinase DesK